MYILYKFKHMKFYFLKQCTFFGVKSFVIMMIFSPLLFSQPLWYHTQNETKPNHYLGFGEGASEAEAKQNALNDIASQISVKIENELIQNKTHSNGGFEKNIQMKSIQKTSANLSDYKVLDFAQERGRFYFKIGYENISNIDKLARKLRNKKDENVTLAPPKSQKFLQQSLMAKSLKEAVGTEVELQIFRRNNAWSLVSNNFVHNISDEEFASFFYAVSNPQISVRTNKKDNILYDGDEFHFLVESSEDGFASIASVYEDGTVVILLKNSKIAKNVLTKLPQKEDVLEPVAGLLHPKQDTFEMQFVIFSDKKLQFDNFADAYIDTTNQEKYKNFGDFLRFLDDKKYASIKVITKAR